MNKYRPTSERSESSVAVSDMHTGMSALFPGAYMLKITNSPLIAETHEDRFTPNTCPAAGAEFRTQA